MIDWKYVLFNVATTAALAMIGGIIWLLFGFEVFAWIALSSISADLICNRSYKR